MVEPSTFKCPNGRHDWFMEMEQLDVKGPVMQQERCSRCRTARIRRAYRSMWGAFAWHAWNYVIPGRSYEESSAP